MIHKIDSSLQAIIDEWSSKRGLPAFPEGFLPENGYVAFVNSKPVMAGYLYKDPTANIAMFEWIISSPDATKEEKDVAFVRLLNAIEDVARELGAKYILTTSDNEHLTKRFQDSSFQLDRKVYHLVKGV